jgi:hypothetical protein
MVFEEVVVGVARVGENLDSPSASARRRSRSSALLSPPLDVSSDEDESSDGMVPTGCLVLCLCVCRVL